MNSMELKSKNWKPSIIVFCFSFLIILLISSFAKAQVRCENLFQKPSIYGSSFANFKELNNAYADLIEILKNKPNMIDSEILDSTITNISEHAEKYFDSNGIAFEKLGGSLSIKNLKDMESYTVFYPIYRLTGSKDGDEISRMIYGAQNYSKDKNHSLKIVFDILYQMRYLDSYGEFNPRSKALFIGPQVIFYQIAGLSSTLRHEIQHYFENIKLQNGEMTLSRISFTEPFPQEKGPYANFLSMDEIETHLRDLRTILNSDLMNAKDNKLSTVIERKETLDAFRKARPAVAKETCEKLQGMIQNTRSALKNIKDVSAFSASVNSGTGAIEIGFIGLPPPYSIVKIQLTGLIGAEKALLNKQELENLSKKVIEWNEQRVQEIETELRSLVLKLQ